MKTHIFKKNNRPIWKIKPISISSLLVPILFLLPVSNISIATKNAVAAPTQCSVIQDVLNYLKEELDNLQDSGGTSQEIKDLIKQISAKKKELERCTNPPPAQANLVIKEIQEVIDNRESKRKYRAVIINNSDVPAKGPFEVTVGVTKSSLGGQTLTSEIRDKASSDVTIAPHSQYYTKYITTPNQLRTVYEVEILLVYQGKLSRLDKTYRTGTPRANGAPRAN